MTAAGDDSRRARWGYIDPDGETVIDFQFEHASPHNEGLAVARSSGMRGQIDRAGKWVIPPAFDSLGSFQQGLATAGRDGKEGYIDKTGHFAIQPTFDGAYAFQGGLAKIKVGGRFGYVDRAGRTVIRPRFEFAGNFCDGLALVRDPEKEFTNWYIDRAGRHVLGPFKAAEDFSEGWASVQDDGCRFMDTRGNTTLRLPPGVYASRFVDGLAVAKDFSVDMARPKWGYIDRRGAWVIPPRPYDFAGPFHGAGATVQVDGRYGMIDRDGRYIAPPEFPELDDFFEARARFKRNDGYGFLDEAGGVVIEPVYHLAQWFAGGLAPVCLSRERD